MNGLKIMGHDEGNFDHAANSATFAITLCLGLAGITVNILLIIVVLAAEKVCI